MPETIPLCGCRIIEAERQADQLVAKLACPIERAPEGEGAPEAGAGEAEAHEQRTRLLRQAAKPLPGGEVLLQR